MVRESSTPAAYTNISIIINVLQAYSCPYYVRATFSRSSGTLGLAISPPARPGYGHLFDNSAAVLFLRNDSLHFQEGGDFA
jgi:hypothetical protein